MLAAGLVIASLGGGELALREHMAGYRSHSALLAGGAAFVAVTVVALGLGPVKVWVLVVLGAGVFARYVLRDARALQAPLRGARVPMNERRLRIAGIHHITLLVADVERSLAFYRNVLGMRLVKQTVNDDDRSARAPDLRRRGGAAGHADHVPRVPRPRRGNGRPRLDAPLRAGGGDRGGARGLARLPRVGGVPTTEVMDRADLKSIYLRDPGRAHLGASH